MAQRTIRTYWLESGGALSGYMLEEPGNIGARIKYVSATGDLLLLKMAPGTTANTVANLVDAIWQQRGSRPIHEALIDRMQLAD